MASNPIPPGRITLSRTFPGVGTSGEISPFPMAPNYLRDQTHWLIQLSHILNGTMYGRTNNNGYLTLTINSATTTVTLTAGRIGINTLVFLVPLTAAAATEFGAGSLYLSDRDVVNNQFTLTHVNSATTGRKFGYILVG